VQSIAILAAALAALIHLWIFAMESLWFLRPTVWSRFGLRSQEDARVVRSFAYNQGFYNLFLAVGVIAGLGLLMTHDFEAARVLVLFACGSMVAAGVVLFLHDRRFLRAAAVQAGPPLVAIAGILVPPVLGGS
jgi:putative membrane protein